MDRGKAFLSRAETAPFADGMADSILAGAELIPLTGNPVWWFPTARTDFASIHDDLDGIVERALIINELPKDADAYQQGMDDLRGKLKTVQEQLGEASAFFFVNPISLILTFFWVIAVSIILSIRSKISTNDPENEPSIA